MLDISRW